jgi:DnaJ-domain-containing protein 1
MMRFVILIIYIAIAYFVFRYVIRTFRQEKHRRSEGSNYQNNRPADTEEEYRQTLGVTAVDSPAAIRKKYKELLAKYHPDKVQHLGIEFQEMAEKKTREIMDAYEFFRKKYNL